MSSLLISRTGNQRERRSTAQIAAFVFGVWWVANGIGAFLVDPNLASSHVHGGGELLGVSITANGWHGLLHLASGFIGIAAARRPRAALTYLLVAGAVYMVLGTWGLLGGGSSVGVIAVDADGDVVHLIEGFVAFATGILTMQLDRVRSSKFN